LQGRESEIFVQSQSGNVPEPSRTLAPIWITNEIAGQTQILKLLVTRDYLAIGVETNSLRVPLTPITAQRIADFGECSLPTAEARGCHLASGGDQIDA